MLLIYTIFLQNFKIDSELVSYASEENNPGYKNIKDWAKNVDQDNWLLNHNSNLANRSKNESKVHLPNNILLVSEDGCLRIWSKNVVSNFSI